MIEYNSGIVPTGSKDRADLLRMADQILMAFDDEAPPIEVEPERVGHQRLRVWSTDLLESLGVEPGAVRFTRAGLRLRADDEVTEYGTEGLEELLAQFDKLTPLERAVAFRVLDGRRTESWSRDTGWQPEKGYMQAVAEAIGITPGSAKVHWSNAKRKMRDTVMAQAS